MDDIGSLEVRYVETKGINHTLSIRALRHRCNDSQYFADSFPAGGYKALSATISSLWTIKQCVTHVGVTSVSWTWRQKSKVYFRALEEALVH